MFLGCALSYDSEVDMSKFADEDREEEEPKSYHIKPQVRGLA
jgi:hypothetical protein